MECNDKKKLSRRHLLKSGMVVAGLSATTFSARASTAGTDTPSLPFSISKLLNEVTLPKAKGARVVVVGGGWSGLSMAKYLKIHNPAFDVILIDKRPEFISFPASNSWLADQVNLDFLTHSYFDAARAHDYRFFNATVLGFDRE